MSSMTTIAVGADFTADDLDSLPDDGNRYELIDGELFVSPSPSVPHQRASVELLHLLRLALPPGLRVLVAPMDVRLGPRRQVQPDLLVVRNTEDDAVRIEQVPLLAVEILSTGSGTRDQITKRRAHEQADIVSYWIVDPKQPALAVLELDGAAYREVARVEGEQAWTATVPCPVTVVPADLLR